jgi:hypothetical protein
MEPLKFSQRIVLFLYSTNNTAGCSLALGGLMPYLGGVIEAYWWLIVAGLYCVGVLAWQRSDLASNAERTELSTEMLAEQVRNLVSSVAKGLLREALEVRSRFWRQCAVICRIPRGVPAAAEILCAGTHARRRKNRRSRPARSIGRARFVTQGCLQERVYRDVEALLTNGQFLQARFAVKEAFLG